MSAKTVRKRPLTSAANPLVKDVRKAIARGTVTESGLAIVEGFHLIDEVLRSQCQVTYILAAESAIDKIDGLERLTLNEIAVLPDALFNSIAATETSQGAIALVRIPEASASRIFTDDALAIVLDGVQDPGNAGAIVRSAEAFGASGVVFMKGSVSPFHPKTLRASAGSLFRVPFTGCSELPSSACRLFAAMPWSAEASSAADIDFTQPCAIVIGSEGRGVSPAMRTVSLPVAIPTRRVESLNAAMAASILLYEASRQRAQHKP